MSYPNERGGVYVECSPNLEFTQKTLTDGICCRKFAFKDESVPKQGSFHAPRAVCVLTFPNQVVTCTLDKDIHRSQERTDNK